MWGGRFDFGSNNVAKKYTSSLDKDKRLFKQDIKSSLAHALALREASLINRKEYSQIIKGLNKILKEIENNKFHWEEELEDIHMNIEFALEKKIGRAAQKLHTGRSRNDQVVTDLKLYLIESINEINSLITKTQKSNKNVI